MTSAFSPWKKGFFYMKQNTTALREILSRQSMRSSPMAREKLRPETPDGLLLSRRLPLLPCFDSSLVSFLRNPATLVGRASIMIYAVVTVHCSRSQASCQVVRTLISKIKNLSSWRMRGWDRWSRIYRFQVKFETSKGLKPP